MSAPLTLAEPLQCRWTASGGDEADRVSPNAQSATNSGCSPPDPCRPALRPTEASKALVCYVRNASTRPSAACKKTVA